MLIFIILCLLAGNYYLILRLLDSQEEVKVYKNNYNKLKQNNDNKVLKPVSIGPIICSEEEKIEKIFQNFSKLKENKNATKKAVKKQRKR